jgi:hypothetical protein
MVTFVYRVQFGIQVEMKQQHIFDSYLLIVLIVVRLFHARTSYYMYIKFKKSIQIFFTHSSSDGDVCFSSANSRCSCSIAS